VTMGIELFFSLAPLLIVLLHLHLLVLEYLLACKIVRLPKELVRDGVAAHFAPALPLNVFLGTPQDRFVRLLLRLLLFAANVFLPQALLLCVQLRFLPYHSFWFTTWHQVLLLGDLVMVRYFYRLTTKALRQAGLHMENPWTLTGRLVWGLSSALLAAFCAFGAIVPGTGWEACTGRPFPLAERLERNISVRGQLLIRGVSPGDSEGERAREGSAEQELRRYRGLKLAGRDLRNADFTNCRLPNADFRGANLEGAKFTGADLRGAQFLPGSDRLRFFDPPGPAKRALASTEWRDHSTLRIAHLRNARFVGANLQGASFLLADLEGADFYDADLHSAELLGARLRRAVLDDAKLQGAEVGYADLTGAQLRGANLTGASLKGAYLLGSNLDGARMWAVNLSEAHLQGATLASAFLDAAELQDAETLGANFRNSSLRGAANLELNGVVLRGSRVGGLTRCASHEPVYLTDLRELDIQPAVSPGETAASKKILETQKQSLQREVLPGPLQAEALLRLAAHFNRPTCLVSRPSALSHREGFYEETDRKGPMAQWPPTQSLAPTLPPGQVWGEPTFYRKLARYLLEQACQDERLATGMAFKIAGPHLAVDPELRAELDKRLADALKTGPGCAKSDVLLAIVCELGKQGRYLPKGASCPGRPKIPRWTGPW
ncbi:MAG TPA: pentapeptide repeat-containing protein, partial [Thermoanaerobaculia bacterium]|nr:pentapeptide repeat-containing protein [Thermoanaerobaculia bacterium]